MTMLFLTFFLYLCGRGTVLACTPDGQDPYQTGNLVLCCSGMKRCLKASANWAYRCQSCSRSCQDDKDYNSRTCIGGSPTPPPAPMPPSPSPGGVSIKRGIARETRFTSQADLQVLSQMVSWWYNWAESSGRQTQAGVSYIPMLWDNVKPNVSNVPQGAEAILGFNEPNLVDQAHMTPQQAAAAWPMVEEAARQKGIPLVVSPAMNFSTWMHPITWLDQFFSACPGCRVDMIAVHAYTCRWQYLESHLNMYRKYNKQIWLTEFACADESSMISQAGQMTYMREVVPQLEAADYIYRYAWFSYDFGANKSIKADLFTNGQLNALGQLYKSLAHNNKASVGGGLKAPNPSSEVLSSN